MITFVIESKLKGLKLLGEHMGLFGNTAQMVANVNQQPSYRYDLDKLTKEEKKRLIFLLSKCRVKDLPDPSDERFDYIEEHKQLSEGEYEGSE